MDVITPISSLPRVRSAAATSSARTKSCNVNWAWCPSTSPFGSRTSDLADDLSDVARSLGYESVMWVGPHANVLVTERAPRPMHITRLHVSPDLRAFRR